MRIRSIALAVTAALALAALAAPVAARAFKKGDLTISAPWTRQTAAGQSVGGGFMTIANRGAQADQLVDGMSPAAERVEIHSMSMDGGVMRMRRLNQGLAIPTGGSVALVPGGFHIMLIGLKRPLALGARVPVTLHFRRAGRVEILLAVESVAFQPSEVQHGGH